VLYKYCPINPQKQQVAEHTLEILENYEKAEVNVDGTLDGDEYESMPAQTIVDEYQDRGEDMMLLTDSSLRPQNFTLSPKPVDRWVQKSGTHKSHLNRKCIF
jgi:hypothetical protein